MRRYAHRKARRRRIRSGQISSRPHIVYLECTSTQSWDVGERERFNRSACRCVYNEHVDSF